MAGKVKKPIENKETNNYGEVCSLCQGTGLTNNPKSIGRAGMCIKCLGKGVYL